MRDKLGEAILSKSEKTKASQDSIKGFDYLTIQHHI